MLLLAPAAAAQVRVVETVIPALESGPSCTSSVELRNLRPRTVGVDVEGHRGTGALALLNGTDGIEVELAPLGRTTLQFNAEGPAWVLVRESVLPGASPVIAAQGVTECLSGNELRRELRDPAFPVRNPWFSGDVDALSGSEIALVNASASAVIADGCYSSGSLYSNPARNGAALQPVCSATFHEQVPPFGTRLFPVRRESTTHFSLTTLGSAVVLQMLRPVDAHVRLFRVDSSIRFGSEIPPGKN